MAGSIGKRRCFRSYVSRISCKSRTTREFCRLHPIVSAVGLSPRMALVFVEMLEMDAEWRRKWTFQSVTASGSGTDSRLNDVALKRGTDLSISLDRRELLEGIGKRTLEWTGRLGFGRGSGCRDCGCRRTGRRRTGRAGRGRRFDGPYTTALVDEFTYATAFMVRSVLTVRCAAAGAVTAPMRQHEKPHLDHCGFLANIVARGSQSICARVASISAKAASDCDARRVFSNSLNGRYSADSAGSSMPCCLILRQSVVRPMPSSAAACVREPAACSSAAMMAERSSTSPAR